MMKVKAKHKKIRPKPADQTGFRRGSGESDVVKTAEAKLTAERVGASCHVS